MANYGKLKIDDLSQTLQDSMTSDRLGLSGGQNVVGYGYIPQAGSKRIDDNDPSIQYSSGDWTRQGYNGGLEGALFGSYNLNSYQMVTSSIGAWFQVSFVGTGLILNTFNNSAMGIASVSVDGGAPYNIDLYNTTPVYGKHVQLASGLSYGSHTVKVTLVGKNSSVSNTQYLRVNFFEVITQAKGNNLLPPFTQWDNELNQNSASTYNIVSPYSLKIKKSSTTGFSNKSIYIPVVQGQTYTFTFNVNVQNISGTIGSGGYYNIFLYDTNKTQITSGWTPNGSIFGTANGNTSTTFTFTIPSGVNAAFVRVLVGCESTVIGDFTYTNPMLNLGSTALPFETNGYDQITLAKDSTWNKSSAFIGGSRVDSTSNVTKSVSEITNIVPNATFDRLSSTWGIVFQDNFDRANGSAGYGWTNGSIVSNQLSIPINTASNNGSDYWTDKQIKFSVVAPQGGFYIYPKLISGQYVRASFLTGSSNNISFEKFINSTFSANITQTSYTITSGTTYYVTVKVQGNIYSASITTNADYVTGATNLYYYNDELSRGRVMLENGGGATAALFDNVVVTAPFPDNWYSNTFTLNGNNGAYYGNGVWGINNYASGYVANIFTAQSTATFPIKVIPGETYTARIKAKIESYTSGNGINISFIFNDASWTNVGSITTSSITTTNSDFVEIITTLTAPSNAVYITFNARVDAVAKVQFKEPMVVLGTYSAGQLQFHTKESRCDLVSLQNDGQVVVTQGSGTSELGYRVEAEDGSISTWFRDKSTILHWDRVKVWKSGTFIIWNHTSLSNNAGIYGNTANDTVSISFVGTGIDFITSSSNDGGLIGVTIDYGTEFIIDPYSPTNIFKNRISIAKNLPYGTHIVKFRVTGQKNDLSVSTFNYLDAFDIYVPSIPSNPSPTTLLPINAVIKADPDYGWIRYEESEGVLSSGNVTDNVYFEASSGTTKNLQDSTASLELSFVGEKVRAALYQSPTRGIVEVLVDDVSMGMFDEYISTSGTYGKFFSSEYGVPFGLHKIKVRNTNTKNASASTVSVTVDGFDVKNSMYVIDLTKVGSQKLIESKIAEHEAKDLFDAHPQAIKGDINKMRIERGQSSVVTLTGNANAQQSIINFSKAFTVPPRVFGVIGDGSGTVTPILQIPPSLITTTGFNAYLYTNSASVGSGYSIVWIAIGN